MRELKLNLGAQNFFPVESLETVFIFEIEASYPTGIKGKQIC